MRTRKLLALLGSATVALGVLTAAAPPVGAATYELVVADPIVFAGTGPVQATSDPSTSTASGMATTITDVDVTLFGVTHTFKGDLDVELVSPQGTAVVLMSDTCGFADATSRDYTFDDAAVAGLPGDVCPSGVYRPTNSPGAGDEIFAVPPVGTSLGSFAGENPNGDWELHVRDDDAGDTGQISAWLVRITTSSTPAITIPSFGSAGSGTATPYPAPVGVSGATGTITDVDLTLPGLFHTAPRQLQVLLVSPTGQGVRLMSGDCGGTDIAGADLVFDDEAAGAPAAACGPGGAFRPTANPLVPMPAPAPPGPYGASLSVFDGTSPNGTWQLFVNDAADGGSGWITGVPRLTFTTTDVVAPQTRFTKKPQNGFATTVKVKFTSSEPGSRFRCRLDDASRYRSCTSPLVLKNLQVGKHKLFVRAVDAAGNEDATPAKVRWRVLRA